MLMWTCNTLYIIDMPLYITADLGLPEGLAGVLMAPPPGWRYRQCCWPVITSNASASAT